MKRETQALLFNTDRHLGDDPVDKLRTLPHGEVKLGRGQPEIWTERLQQLPERQVVIPCHQAYRLTCQLCLWALLMSCRDSLWITDNVN